MSLMHGQNTYTALRTFSANTSLRLLGFLQCMEHSFTCHEAVANASVVNMRYTHSLVLCK